MTIEERDRLRQLALARDVLKSCREAAKEVWKRRCRSDRPIRLSLQERVNNLSCVMPQGIPASKVIGQMPKKGLKASRTPYTGGYRYPKQGWRSVQVNRRGDLLASGLPEELVDQIISAQVKVIRIPEKARKLRDFLAKEGEEISLREARDIHFQALEDQRGVSVEIG